MPSGEGSQSKRTQEEAPITATLVPSPAPLVACCEGPVGLLAETSSLPLEFALLDEPLPYGEDSQVWTSQIIANLKWLEGRNLFVPATFVGKTVQTLLDTGSPKSSVNLLHFPTCLIPGLAREEPKPGAAQLTGAPVMVTGNFRARIQSNAARATLTVYVVPGMHALLLLGLDALASIAINLDFDREYLLRTGRPASRKPDAGRAVAVAI